MTDPLPAPASGQALPPKSPWLGTAARRRWTVILAGGLTALSLPPSPAWLLMPVGLLLATMAWARAARGREAFWLGWWFGAVQQLLLLYWLAAALFVDIDRWWWAVPVAVLAFPALLGLVFALQVRLLHALRLPVTAVLALPAVWMLGELARTWLFTGFPWMLSGYASLGWLPLAQAAGLVGVIGLGGLMALLAALMARIAWARSGKRRLLWAGAAGAVLALWAGAGGLRIAHWDTVARTPAEDAPRLHLVQPNIAQGAKWDPAAAAENLGTLMQLSTLGLEADAILWPETAPPFFMEWRHRTREMEDISSLLLPGQLLLTGANRRVAQPMGAPFLYRYYNALHVFDDRLQELAVYDKSHLVPFGEYQPLSQWLPLPAVATGNAQFSPGPGPRTLSVDGLPPFSVTICYEVLFPHLAAPADDPPAWLLTVTNDGWFGTTLGPHQHFHMARMRAIEQGVPLVRVANTGISGQVDSLGRVQSRTTLGESATLTLALLPPLPERPWGPPPDLWLLICSMILLLLATLWRRQTPKTSSAP